MLVFSSILGQEHAKKTLRTTLGGRRPAHAFLFTGPAGVGKRTMARAVAALVNCDRPDKNNGDACGVCPSCRKMAAGTHPDCVVVQPSGSGIRISQVREMIRALDFPPHQGKNRVVILEQAHTLGREAANSLLKTLEEPPPSNFFILAADSGRALLPTIRSRCQTVLFVPLRPEQVVSFLRREDIALEPEQAEALAIISGGSPGRARELADAETGQARRDLFMTLFASDEQKDPVDIRLYGLARQVAARKELTGRICEFLSSWYRDLLLLASGGWQEHLMNRDFSHLLAACAANRKDGNDFFQKIGYIRQAERELARNCNAAHVFLVLFYRLVATPWNVTNHGTRRQGSAHLPSGKRLQGAGDARYRPAMCAGVHEQADNTADSVPCDRLPWNR